MTPTERTARVRALRAEARAWRRAARWMDRANEIVWPLTCAFLYIGADEAMYRAMRARFYLHWERRMDGLVYMPRAEAVVLCLFLALECEDEAKEVGRG